MSFSKVSIDGKEYASLRNIKYLGNSYLLDALIHPIIENINQGKYVTKLNDAYDKDGDTLTDLEEGSVVLPDSSSLIVNFRLLAQDIVTCTDSLYIKNQFELIETVYSYLFEKEFFCIPSNFEKISDIFRKCKTIYKWNCFNFSHIINNIIRQHIKYIFIYIYIIKKK